MLGVRRPTYFNFTKVLNESSHPQNLGCLRCCIGHLASVSPHSAVSEATSTCICRHKILANGRHVLSATEEKKARRTERNENKFSEYDLIRKFVQQKRKEYLSVNGGYLG